MTIVKYRPTKPVLRSLLEDFWGGTDLMSHNLFNENKWLPSVNIKETDTNFIIDLMAPGFKKSDFKITVENGMLTISSDVTEETEETNEKYTRKEYSFNSFTRTFTVPENVDVEKIHAEYNDGILELTMDKVPEAISKPIEIGIE
jgi:HSP20 family protein